MYQILIAALIGYLVLPRALARLWKKSEWSEGHMLQCKAKNGNPIPNLGDAIKLSIVPAYSNLHVLVMLAHLGILLSAFDSYVCRGLVVSPQSFKPRPKRYSMSAPLGHVSIHAWSCNLNTCEAYLHDIRDSKRAFRSQDRALGTA